MDHARAIALACYVLAGGAACLRTTYPDAEKSSGVETTAASPVIREPDPTLDDIAARLADQICAREVGCHDDPSVVDACLRMYLGRSRAELARWRCSPAAARARAEECLPTLRQEPCSTDLTLRRTLCEPNAKCPDPDTRLVAPGRALADAGI